VSRQAIYLLVVVSLAIMVRFAEAVTIYRLGGEWLPPPAETEQQGVEFRQLSWSQVGEAGGLVRLQIPAGITPLQYTESVPLELSRFNSSSRTMRPLYDRDFTDCGLCTSVDLRGYLCGVRNAICRGRYGLQGTINIDLGDRVLLDRIRIHSSDELGRAVLGDFGLFLSTVPLGTDRTPRSPLAMEFSNNLEADLELKDLPDEVRMAAVQLAVAEHDPPVTIHEIEIFARGPASHAEYTSDIIDFGQPAVWGDMRWGLHKSGSKTVVTTRAGEGDDLFVYWKYAGIGDTRLEVTRQEYETIRSTLRAGTTYNYDSWTVWSAAGNLGDTTLAPPLPVTPHPAFQLNVTFDTEGEWADTLDFIEFRASVPPVTLALGELSPIQVSPGGLTDFTYSLKARVEPADTGFDRIQISAVAARVQEVTGVTIEEGQVPFTLEAVGDDGFVVALPRVGLDQADAIIQVHFRARVLRYGASFACHLLDSDRPYDLPQPVQPGDALEEIFSDRVWIETTIQVESVLAATASPRVITPNGDGVADVTRIVYDIFETTGLVPVSVQIYDLAGRRLRVLHDGRQNIGHYERDWDGRDDGGRLVPPGIYLFRAVALVEGGEFSQMGMIHVAY
jgi:hypothetical protein